MCISANILSSKVQALEHNLQWSLATRAEHVDNVFLSPAQKEYLASALLAPQITYGVSSPTWQGSLNTWGNFRRTSDPAFDTNDYQYLASFIRKKAYSSLSGEIKRLDTTVRENSLAESGRVTNDPLITDTARVNWQRHLTAADTVSLRGDYTRRDYDSANYSDFDDWRLTGLWQRGFSDVFAAQAEFYYGEYVSGKITLDQSNVPPTAIDSENRSDNLGAQIGIFGQFSPTLSYNFLAGAARVHVQQTVLFYLQDEHQIPFLENHITEDNASNLVAATLDYKGARLQLNMAATKQLQASGDGFQYDTRMLQFGGRYRLGEFHSLQSNISYGEQLAVTGADVIGSRFNRDFGYADLGLNYRLTEFWHLSVTAHYNVQKFAISSSAAESLTGVVQFRYVPSPVTW